MSDTPDITYRLEVQPAPYGKYRVTLLAGNDPKAMDKADLDSEAVRDALVEKWVAEFPGLPVDALRAELLRRIAECSQPPAGPPGEADGPPGPEVLLRQMPPEAVDAAEAMLRDPELIRLLSVDLAEFIAGEAKLAMNTYLTGTSRLLDEPLSAITHGPTASGKSFVPNEVGNLFPPEEVIRATQITTQALYYMPPGSLKHKWVIAGERSRAPQDEVAEATRALREMLASRRLSKAVAVKMGDRYETVIIVQDGPIAYTESTTLAEVFEEDANRSLSLTTDESAEQTKRIIGRQAAEARSGRPKRPAAIVAKHHALQRLLARDRADVVIPYAVRLGELFPTQRVEARRAFRMLVYAIKTIALLHLRQRERTPDGHIVATADDYRLAYELLAEPLAQHVAGSLPSATQKFFKALYEETRAGETFTVAQAAKKVGKGKTAASDHLGVLEGKGIVEVETKGSGSKPTVYKFADDGPKDCGPTLPKPAEVFPPVGQPEPFTAV